jgi:3-deoxy-D-manno-octulosonic-acid transferase
LPAVSGELAVFFGVKFLFTLLYDSGLFFYRAGIFFASFFHPKARRWRQGRKQLLSGIQSQLRPSELRIWFHCASAGEFEQARPVMEACRQKFPGHSIVLTFFSPSGFDLQKNYAGADYIFYLPVDTRRHAQKFLQLVNPRLAVFVKYEFWFHFLSQLAEKQIPAILISVILRPNHFLFRPLAQPLRDVVKPFMRIFVQDENSLRLLQQHHLANGEVAGDTRFDRVWQIAQSPGSYPLIEKFIAGKPALVAGSTWPADERLLVELLEKMEPSWKLIIAPHETGARNIVQLLQLFPEASLYSQLSGGVQPAESRVLIVDRVGMLSSLYRYAAMAFIGGGFGAGIHNTLEAAVFGIPVIFGPHYHKFNEAIGLVNSGGGKSVANAQQLLDAFRFYVSDEGISRGRKNRNFVEEQTGATEKIVTALEQVISGNGASRG